MVETNGKEHNVVIANCSRECGTLPLDGHLWVHFVPGVCGVVCRIRDHAFHSLRNISKTEVVLLAVFAGFIC